MSINNVSSVSFKACIPVKYFAKNPNPNSTKGRYLPVLKNKNIRKCHRYVVTNLNGTAKNYDKGFVDFYKKYDPDYRMVSEVQSVYNEKGPIVHLVTGGDIDTVRQLARPVGEAKRESIEILGDTSSYDASLAARNFEREIHKIINNQFTPVKSIDDKKPLEMHVYFSPEYGKREGKLKGFNFVGVTLVDKKTQKIKDYYKKD